MTRYGLLTGVFAFAVVTSVASAAPDIGDKAPSLAAGAWLNLPDGVSELDQADISGRIVLVEFWATWCGPCRASIPHLTKLQKQYQDRGVLLLALCDES